MTGRIRKLLSADCPGCGAGGQRVVWWKGFSQRAATQCRGCGAELQSELSFLEYLAVCAFSTATTLLVGWVFVIALVIGRWGLAAIAGLVVVAPPLALGVAFHSRHLKLARTGVDRSKAA